ncbi:MAG TPA: hypothetical protein VGG16_11665 [Streptosporangiaceae bacterium]
MTIPDPFPRRMSRPPVAATPASGPAAGAPAAAAPASWRWRRAALLLSGAAQLITISALQSADPLTVTWAALLLAIAPAPLAALAAFAPARIARVAAPLAAVVLVAGIVGEIAHTGLFFVPALAVMAVAAVMLRREGS